MKPAGMTARILTMTTENKIDRDNESDAYNLLPSSLEKILPKLYATEKIPEEKKIAYAKFFAPNSRWTWYVVEGAWNEDREDYIFFGLVEGFEREYGYFSLNELRGITNPFHKIERDLYFEPTELSNCVYLNDD